MNSPKALANERRWKFLVMAAGHHPIKQRAFSTKRHPPTEPINEFAWEASGIASDLWRDLTRCLILQHIAKAFYARKWRTARPHHFQNKSHRRARSHPR